jgi:hypothetical protein
MSDGQTFELLAAGLHLTVALFWGVISWDVAPEPFFSLKAHATGFGLAIAKRTIDVRGGRIEATCPPGGGMAMRVELPPPHRG